MLLEFFAGHEIDALWLIRTKEKAYWWSLEERYSSYASKQQLSAEDYDRAFETIKCWKQHNASKKKLFESEDGYVGFLSLYENGKSRQMLVASKDFLDSWTKELSEIQDKARWGRLWKTLEPIYSAIEQQKQSTPVSK